MSRIVVIGGHGKVARILARTLTRDGHEVQSVIRDPGQSDDIRETAAEPVVLDIEHADRDAIADAVRGADAVVWSAGAGGGSAERTYAVDRDAAIRAIDAATQASVRRFVMVSYSGARTDHGIDPGDPFFAYAEAKAAADEHLRSSGLDFTIVAPSTLTDDDATDGVDQAVTKGSVPRGDVAAVIRAVLRTPKSIGATLRFDAGRTPIPEFVEAPPQRD